MTTRPITILYLHDHEDWSVHNVGKLWLNGTPELKVTFRDTASLTRSDFSSFDLVWFGYFDLYLHHYLSGSIPSESANKVVVGLHDPGELYPERSNWQRALQIRLKKWWSFYDWYQYMKLSVLRRTRFVIVTSREMQEALAINGISALHIPTTSSLPLRRPSDIATSCCTILSVFERYRRKNVALIEYLQERCRIELDVRFDTKIGKQLLPVEEYISLFDQHELYICTSFQEGGPLPAMEAMQRGCVVLSTPVGQIQDILIDGHNGYICHTKEEFLNRIGLLAGDLPRLHRMRLNALETISNQRSEREIRNIAANIVQQIYAESETGSATRPRRARRTWQRSIYRLGQSGFGSTIDRLMKSRPHGLKRISRYGESRRGA